MARERRGVTGPSRHSDFALNPRLGQLSLSAFSSLLGGDKDSYSSLAMNISQSIPSSVTSVAFSFLTAEDIRRISVKQIVNPVLLDDNNRPNHGGLYDPALGPADRKDMCVSGPYIFC